MVGFLGGLLRVIIGFVLSCLTAGAVQVLFAVTPSELADAGWEYWNQGGVWVLESATIFAVFALPFAAVSALISEWFGIRSFAYHGFIGIAIAIAGFGLITTGEAEGVPTIVNSYAMAAFLTTGLVAGFTYWLFAGRFAYRSESDDDEDDTVKSPPPVGGKTVPSGLASPSAAPKPSAAQPASNKPTASAKPAPGNEPKADNKAGNLPPAAGRPTVPPGPTTRPTSGQRDPATQPPSIPKRPVENGSQSKPLPPAGSVPPTQAKPKTFDA